MSIIDKNIEKTPYIIDILAEVCYCKGTVTKKYFSKFSFVFAFHMYLLHDFCNRYRKEHREKGNGMKRS